MMKEATENFNYTNLSCCRKHRLLEIHIKSVTDLNRNNSKYILTNRTTALATYIYIFLFTWLVKITTTNLCSR